MQHFVRSPVANAVAIDPAKSSTASHFASAGGTPSAVAATASFLAIHVPWVAFFSPVLVAAVVGLITVMGVELFCDWSGTYLARFSETWDETKTGGNNN
jgi:negative regulator of sigma E activity